MKTILKTTGFLFIALTLFTACSNDDDSNPGPVDPREAFLGEYETEDYELTLTLNPASSDTTIVVNGGVEIEIELNEDNLDEIIFKDLEDFLEDGANQMFFALGSTGTAAITSDEDIFATINDDEFELEEADLIISAGMDTLPLTLSGGGSIEENVLVLEFEYSYSTGGTTGVFSGVVEMEKQEE